MKVWSSLFLVMWICTAQAAEIQQISLPLIPDIQRADIYFIKLSSQPKAILILCPGCNGDGRGYLQNPVWLEFARAHNLDLAGISFASDVNLLEGGRGYYYASQGSGALLVNALNKIYGHDIPIIMYGFSGGAHFTARFTGWKPERIMGWCAYSAGWWDTPITHKASPPGLIACGENDERLGPSLTYFKQGRSLGEPWLWLCAPNTGHSIYPPAEDFVRNYFAAILDNDGLNVRGIWVDIDLKKEAAPDLVSSQPSLTGWIPDTKLLTEWKEVHHP